MPILNRLGLGRQRNQIPQQQPAPRPQDGTPGNRAADQHNNVGFSPDNRHRITPRAQQQLRHPNPPTLPPIREQAHTPRLRHEPPGRFGELGAEDRPPARSIEDRAIREAIRGALDVGNNEKKLSQTYLATQAHFGERLAGPFHELRKLLKASSFPKAQFPELATLLENNTLFNYTAESAYDAFTQRDQAAQRGKLLQLSDTLSALKLQIAELPPNYASWKTALNTRIDTVSYHAQGIASGDFRTPHPETEGRDPVVRGVLVQSEEFSRYRRHSETLDLLNRNLGTSEAKKLYEVKLIVNTVEKNLFSPATSHALENAITQYSKGQLNDDKFSAALKGIRQNLSVQHNTIQSHAIKARLISVERALNNGQTLSATAKQAVEQLLQQQIVSPTDSRETALTERNFTRSSLIIPQEGKERSIVPRQAAARLATLDLLSETTDALTPPRFAPSLQSLFESAHSHPADRHVLGARLEHLRQSTQSSKQLAGRKAAVFELIAQAQADIEAHFSRNNLIETNSPNDLRAWISTNEHLISKEKLQTLQNTLSMIGVPKALQVNFALSLSRYLHPETTTQSTAPYQLLVEDGAALLKAINTAEVDPDIRDLGKTALRAFAQEITAVKAHPQRNYSAYRARDGQTEFKPNVLSPGQRKDFDHWSAVVTAETGIERNPLRKATRQEAKQIAQVWISHLAELREDFREDYGRQRNQLAEAGVYGVSMVLQHNALVCRELSVVASALFAEFGVTTQVGSGTVNTNTQNPGAHAWLEVLDDNRQVSLIVDSNFKRAQYDRFEDYDKAGKGVTYRSHGGQQTVVQINPTHLFSDIQNSVRGR